jgi:hypothetical protein
MVSASHIDADKRHFGPTKLVKVLGNYPVKLRRIEWSVIGTLRFMVPVRDADEAAKRFQFFITISCEGMHCAVWRFRVGLELEPKLGPWSELGKRGYWSGTKRLRSLAKVLKRYRIQQPSTNGASF